jgi:thioredoxin reductase
MDGVDLKDQMARTNCKYTKNLFLRLGVASNPHLEMAKVHAASMKTSALTWQEKAINSINEVAANIQQDHKKTLRDIKKEAAKEAKELSCQTLVAALGFTANIGPLAEWGLNLESRKIVVDSGMHTNIERLFAAGDISTYPGKVALISVGFGEAATAVNNAMVAINPDAHLFPGHSSGSVE